MSTDYTQNRLLQPLRLLTLPQRQNLIVLILAVQLARSFILYDLALFMICAISSASCYRRLERLVSVEGDWGERFARAWVRAVLAVFAPGHGMLVLLIDWTLHRDRCRSLWIALPVGGRAVPLACFLAPATMGGKGTQRTFEDAALTKLREWLPKRRRALLVGDRGFRGLDRMRFLKRLGFRFLLRVTGDTNVEIGGTWVALRDLAPAVGARRAWKKVRYGKTATGGPLRVNLVAVRQALLEPKRVRTNKGKTTQKVVEDTVWFLATDLPLSIDVVALYRQRMEIEETFRDAKALLGMERERTKQPEKRLRRLMGALMIRMALDLQQGGATPVTPARLPRCSGEETTVPPAERAEYPARSATREGLHDLIVGIGLSASPFTAELQAIAAKSERMKARPQVRERRRLTPAPRRRTKAQVGLHVHA